MADNFSIDEYNEKLKEIGELKNKLSSNFSDIGDWKISKCEEYAMLGLEIPYDLNELHSERQAVRDRINELQEEIDSIANGVDVSEGE